MSPELGRKLNVLFVLAVTLILLSAYGVQFGEGELPCPLCLLQRLAMLGVGTGAALNVLYGVRPRNYGLSLASATFGGIVAGRQVLLHIQPGDPGFGAAVVWAAPLHLVVHRLPLHRAGARRDALPRPPVRGHRNHFAAPSPLPRRQQRPRPVSLRRRSERRHHTPSLRPRPMPRQPHALSLVELSRSGFSLTMAAHSPGSGVASSPDPF